MTRNEETRPSAGPAIDVRRFYVGTTDSEKTTQQTRSFAISAIVDSFFYFVPLSFSAGKWEVGREGFIRILMQM